MAALHDRLQQPQDDYAVDSSSRVVEAPEVELLCVRQSVKTPKSRAKPSNGRTVELRGYMVVLPELSQRGVVDLFFGPSEVAPCEAQG